MLPTRNLALHSLDGAEIGSSSEEIEEENKKAARKKQRQIRQRKQIVFVGDDEVQYLLTNASDSNGPKLRAPLSQEILEARYAEAGIDMPKF